MTVTASAQFEINEAVFWYDAINPELADHLLALIDTGYSQIQLHPEMWPPFAGRYRHYLIARFPYAIIYLELENSIEILALAHHKREPGYWLKDKET